MCGPEMELTQRLPPGVVRAFPKCTVSRDCRRHERREGVNMAAEVGTEVQMVAGQDGLGWMLVW